MKPILLKMSAFGPYANETIVDFAKLGGHGIFLLTGDTGAGKTTIFDAICYALYDGASGQFRQVKSFRSDYAAQEAETYVEFTFEHNGRSYRVRRNPEYERAKKRGDGTTKQSADATFEELDSGKIWNGVTSVKAQVEQLIGLTRDQFSQTVMIAQGDFQKILNAESKDRSMLFRKLFNTTLYEQVSKQLLEMCGQCDREKERLEDNIKNEMARIAAAPDFSESRLIARYRTDGDVPHLLEVLERLTQFEKAQAQSIARQKKENDECRTRLVRVIAEAGADNEKFDKLEIFQNKLEALIGRQSEMDDKTRRVNRARRAVNLSGADNALKANREALEKLGSEHAKAAEEVRKMETDLPAAEAEARRAAQALPQADDLLARARRLNDCIPTLTELEKNKREYEIVRKALEKRLGEVQKKEEVYRHARSAYYANQYGLIAAELVEGEACPVCGSKEHPAKAVPSAESVTQAELQSTEDALGTAKDRLSSENARAERIKGQMESAEKQLAETGVVGTADEIRRRAEQMQQDAKRLRKISEDAQKALNDLQREYGVAQEKLSSTLKRLEEERAKQSALSAEFERQLVEFGFENRADYEAARLAPQEIEKLDAQIRRHGEERSACESQVGALRNELTGRQRVDLSALEQEKQSADVQKREIEKEEKQLNSRMQTNADALKNIRKYNNSREKKRHYWAMVRETYQVVSGQHVAAGQKSGKLKLEAYVQQHYFKQVVYAANQRLRRMTEGMFTLRCKEEAANLRSQAGLDLDVFDRSTGRWRDVKTLSGGESFMASLALALGLSDVVQAGSGGIRMDSMFIDEGFGSLDENALNHALEMLASLADGRRLIGVISHVQELRERIDRKIVVRKTQNGSTVEVCC